MSKQGKIRSFYWGHHLGRRKEWPRHQRKGPIDIQEQGRPETDYQYHEKWMISGELGNGMNDMQCIKGKNELVLWPALEEKVRGDIQIQKRQFSSLGNFPKTNTSWNDVQTGNHTLTLASHRVTKDRQQGGGLLHPAGLTRALRAFMQSSDLRNVTKAYLGTGVPSGLKCLS